MTCLAAKLVTLVAVLGFAAPGLSETRPMPAERPAETQPMPREGSVAEPDGYRGDPYKAPVPATLTGARTITDETAQALWWSGRIPFVDVMPTPVRPPELPEGTIWRDPPRESIPGAIWLANTGYQGLDPASQDYFLKGLAHVTGGYKSAPFVVFCMSNCWMSWNAGKRALEHGYTHVFWYPGGAEAWGARGWPLERVTPWKP